MDSKFRITRRGYDVEEVNIYIAKLETELETLRSNQGIISQAIVHAENTSKQIIDAAKKEADEMLLNASNQLEHLHKKLKFMRMKVDSFQSNYNQLIHKYVISMNHEDFTGLYDSIDKISDSLLPNHTTTEESIPMGTREAHKLATSSKSNTIVEMKYEKALADY
ncbi:MAG: hypothetical protein JW708_04760 [Vallitaleaceae bacterium]|nr:hypothetical protein [Vallitaleaceae bacterium]